MSSLSILHIVASIGLYGKEQVVLELMRQHQAQGHRPILGNLRLPGEAIKPIEAAALEEGLQVQPFFLKRGMDFRGASAITQFAKKQRVDLIHIHDYKGSILLGFPRWVRKTPPLLRTLHGFTTTSSFSKIAVYEWLDRMSLRFHDLVVGVSEDMKEHFPLAPIVRNGISTYRSPEASPDYPVIREFCDQGPVIGAVARLSPEKNLVSLVEALAILRHNEQEARLLIIGDGGERSHLEQKVAELGLEAHVLMPGFVDDARKVMRWMDVLVQPSFREGTPITILEAMEARVPLAMTPVGAMAYFLEQDAGWEVPTGPGGIAEVLMSCLGDERLRNERANNAFALYQREYSGAVMAQSYLALYESVAKS
ncbi:MAG: glycosyltransferase family 1 protein [Deltaproteobacteria bacterium]|nr:MAG: glycosyltransferase family 1 protein [Deltaproteobacteria bacterium]